MKKETASEHYSITGIKEGKTSIPMDLYLWDTLPGSETKVGLLLEFEEKTIESIADNFFFALRHIRLELEKNNILLNCYGASLDVFPSPMILDMGEARVAYKLYIGESAKRSDLVSIFESDDGLTPSTVANQEEYYETWLKSLSEG